MAEDSRLWGPAEANQPTEILAPLPEYFDDEPAPYTVGMILFAVTVSLTILLLFYQLRQYSNLYGGAAWKAWTNQTSEFYVPVFEAIFYFEWLVKGLAIFASLLLFIPFLRKSYAFLRWVRVYLVACFIFVLLAAWAGREMETKLREKSFGKTFTPFIDQLHWYTYVYMIMILVTIIWFLYFTTSKRVAKTFLN